MGTFLLSIALSIPLLRGKVGPNSVYGFRTPKTMSSPQIWYRANRAAARNMILAGGAGMGVVLLLPLLGLAPRVADGASLAVLIGFETAALIASMIELRGL